MEITKELLKQIHFNAVGKGFYDHAPAEPWIAGDDSTMAIERRLLLIVTEVAEACEELRKLEPCTKSLGLELADICIRVFDLAEYLDIDLIQLIHAKHSQNIARPRMHGKRF